MVSVSTVTRTHCQVELGWSEGGQAGWRGLPSPVNLSAACHVAVPPRCLTTGSQALCRCLIIVSQWYAGPLSGGSFSFLQCWHWTISQNPFILTLFLLLCYVPVHAYRRTNDNRAELSDHTNCGIICIYCFWVVDSLASSTSNHLRLFVYSRVATRNCLPHKFRAFVFPVMQHK